MHITVYSNIWAIVIILTLTDGFDFVSELDDCPVLIHAIYKVQNLIDLI